MRDDQKYLHLYGTEWKKARARFLREHPLCADCQKIGKLVPANTVDHITPHKGDMGLFWDESNWSPSCRPCHSRKTAMSDGGFGNVPNSKPGKSCGLDGIPTDTRHHWKK